MSGEEAKEPTAAQTLVVSRLTVLAARRTPLQAIASGPTPGVARLAWADGTVLLGRSPHHHTLGRLAIAMQRMHPTIVSWSTASETVVVTFAIGDARHPRTLDVEILGPDQPD